jgi:release factor glutamine methyltransferase
MSATIKSAISEGAETLAASGVNESRSDAALLLMHVLQSDRAFLVAHPERILSADQLERFRSLVSRRAQGEPLQYITSHQEFFKLDFELTPDVLIPRPETELIVEVGLELLKHKPAPTLADIGTGSGCIAISLLHELTNARAVAVDLSPAALAVATKNAARHQVINRLRLVKSDLFSAIDSGECFDVIVSNPPYVPVDDLMDLPREVRHEPQDALDGGTDGLAVIRRLLNDAPKFLRSGGYLVFEIGIDQAKGIKQIVEQTAWELVEIRKDLQGIPRTVVLRKN